MIRHLKKDVLTDLPPKTRKIIFVNEVPKLQDFERSILINHSMEELMGEEYGLGDVARYRREVGEAKLTAAFIYINELLENSQEKIGVVAHHISIVEGLTNLLKAFNPIQIRGGLTGKEKYQRAKLFQDDPRHRVVIGNIESMGEGLTLTRAPGLVVVEPDWRPGKNEQVEDRFHRISQNQNVYVRYLVLRNSLDERMLYRVLEKQASIDQLMN
jgi:SWI/SNF-related matrix-associated actin-dependent regulator 1 of chromatin subfamily A